MTSQLLSAVAGLVAGAGFVRPAATQLWTATRRRHIWYPEATADPTAPLPPETIRGIVMATRDTPDR